MVPSFTPDPVAPRAASPAVFVREALSRPGGRRSLNAVVAVLALAGLGMFAYPAGTDLWQHHLQSGLKDRFGSAATADRYRSRTVAVGDGLTRLQIPKIGLDVLVVQGTTAEALKAGAGHYATTPLPGEEGNVGIAGHRTTYGRPFNRIDELRLGDHVLLDTPFSEFDYAVTPTFDGGANPHPVAPSDSQVIAASEARPGEHLLTLTTCHPKGSAAQRLILRLSLVAARPLPSPGPARAGKSAA